MNRVYNILEGDGSAEEKRASVIQYISYSVNKLPQDTNGRQRLAQNFYNLLNTNYFADVDDDELRLVLQKAGELRSSANQTDDAWNNVQEMIEHL